MKTKREQPIPEYKKRAVAELKDLIKNKKTILVASIKNIPGSQFQEIGKKLRGKAIVKVPKKNLIFRAIDESGNAEIKKLEEKIDDSFAILFSDLDSFELAGELLKNTSPSKAKAGQEAPFDIEVEAGPTELLPGPAISELGALGIQIQIEKGKISIKESKIIAKKGEKIKPGAADLMAKLDIKPFTIGFLPLCAFDTKENKLYTEIRIDRDEAVNELKVAFGKALSFAVAVDYVSKDTIGLFLQKAGAQANKINRVVTGTPDPARQMDSNDSLPQSRSEPDAVAEEKTEEKKEEKAPVAAGLGALFG